jgi:hypothetical protein
MSKVDDLSRAKDLLHAGRLAESLVAFTSATGDPHVKSEALYEIGCIRRRQGDWDGASNAFRASLRYGDSSANSAFALGEIAESDELPAVARAYFPRWPLQIPPPVAGQIPPGRTEELSIVGCVARHARGGLLQSVALALELQQS